MIKYRIDTYLTFSGKKKIIDLGNHSYGEWIISEKKFPKYHINIFRKNSESDILIYQKLKESKLEITTIINTINTDFNTDFVIQKSPKFALKIKSNLKKLDLKPFPVKWIKSKK